MSQEELGTWLGHQRTRSLRSSAGGEQSNETHRVARSGLTGAATRCSRTTECREGITPVALLRSRRTRRGMRVVTDQRRDRLSAGTRRGARCPPESLQPRRGRTTPHPRGAQRAPREARRHGRRTDARSHRAPRSRTSHPLSIRRATATPPSRRLSAPELSAPGLRPGEPHQFHDGLRRWREHGVRRSQDRDRATGRGCEQHGKPPSQFSSLDRLHLCSGLVG